MRLEALFEPGGPPINLEPSERRRADVIHGQAFGEPIEGEGYADAGFRQIKTWIGSLHPSGYRPMPPRPAWCAA